MTLYVINFKKHYFKIILSLSLMLLCLVLLFKAVYGFPGVHWPGGVEVQEAPSPFGEFLRWPEASKLFPKYARALVIDVETGLGFRVQRRAGRHHADVQPLTAEDTAIMKKIYNGKWSWKRRAVVVQLDSGKRIAASMTGMPHGGGAIRGNDFNGHFCIHFRDSKTHIAGKVNLSHQIMVWKAAGRVVEELSILTPKQVIEVFLAAADQGDASVAEKALAGPLFYNAVLLKGMEDIEQVRAGGIIKTEEPNLFEVSLALLYGNKDWGNRGQVNKNIKVRVVYMETQGWKINPLSLISQLESDREIWNSSINIFPDSILGEEEETANSEPWQ